MNVGGVGCRVLNGAINVVFKHRDEIYRGGKAMLNVEAPVVAGQSAMEAAGAATTGAMLAGTSPAMVGVMPMGGEEVSAMLAAAIESHSAQFLAVTGVAVAQRAMLAAQIGTSAAVYTTSNALSAASLAL
jgi:hypothetical protein